MRIGILADIHDAVAPLEVALSRFDDLAVDQVVSLGDAFDSFKRGDPGVEVARLLRAAGAVGVWGNHDYGLSHNIHEEIRKLGDPSLLEFSLTLKPQVVVDGCRFSHLEPWLDATVIEDLWFFDGVPVTPKHTERCFAAVPESFLFVGHFHCWAVTTDSGPLPWTGTDTLVLDPERRHLIVMAPVAKGQCAVFDTLKTELIPVDCG